MALGYHPRIQLIISRGIGQWEAQSHNHDDGQHIRVGGIRPLAVTHSGSLCARLGDETLAGPRGACSDTIAPAMLSHAQEARVQDVLGNHPPGTIQTYCPDVLPGASSRRREDPAREPAGARGLPDSIWGRL